MEITREGTTLTFDASDYPIPLDVEELEFSLIYYGKLGHQNETAWVGEEKGVAVGRRIMNCGSKGLEIALPSNGIYALLRDHESITNPQTQGFSSFDIGVRNLSDFEMDEGKVKLMLYYRLASINPFSEDWADQGGQVSFESFKSSALIEESISIPMDCQADFHFAINLPLWAIDLYGIVLYMDNETNEFFYGTIDFSEPSPIDTFNCQDVICIDGQFYQTGSAEAIAAADNPDYGGNANGEPDDYIDIYPHKIDDLYIRFSSRENPVHASVTNYNCHINDVMPHSYARVFVIGDETSAVSILSKLGPLTSDDTYDHNKSRYWSLFESGEYHPLVVNREEYDYEDLAYYWRLTGFRDFRGLDTFFGCCDYDSFHTGCSIDDLRSSNKSARSINNGILVESPILLGPEK